MRIPGGALRPQREEQRRQVEELDRRLTEADATLARLRAQQGILKRGWKRRRAGGGLPPVCPARRRLELAVAGTFLIVTAAAAMLSSYSIERAKPPPVPKPDASADAARGSWSQLPRPNPKAPAGAALLMTFDKNTIVDRAGAIVLVQSLTRRTMPRGLAAGIHARGQSRRGLVVRRRPGTAHPPKTIINDRPDYTLTAWFKRTEKEQLWIYSETRWGMIFGIDAIPNGSVMVTSWHYDLPNNWMTATTPEGVAPAGQWAFLTVRLSGGGRQGATDDSRQRSLVCVQPPDGPPRIDRLCVDRIGP